MTGFGRGDAAGDGITWSVELSSVNRKQLEVAASLPRELAELEPNVRTEVAAHCSRGRVNVVIRSDARSGSGSALKLDEALAQQYLGEARKLAAMLDVAPTISLADAMRWPGVIASETTTITTLLSDIATRSAEVPSTHRAALLQRLQDAGLPVDLSDERLIKEIALFADRCDISEELARTRSHLAQFAKQLAAKEALGRNMDFLSQELFREFNTMGAKAHNADLTHLIVQAKTEIEKIREQVQNVE